jgi:hypothetical protein
METEMIKVGDKCTIVSGGYDVRGLRDGDIIVIDEILTDMPDAYRHKGYGFYRDELLRIEPQPLEKTQPVKPTPFPEPERWAMGRISSDTFVDADSGGFDAQTNQNAKAAIAFHNAEIDRLMREIRRLEALVESGGAK